MQTPKPKLNVRFVVFALLALVIWQISAGFWTFFSNQVPLPFDFHRFGAAAVLIILVFKGQIIYRSLRAQLTHHHVLPRTYLSLLLLFVLIAVLLLALLWFFNLLPTFITGSTTPLDVHIWIAIAMVPLMFVHAGQHLFSPRMAVPLGRREALGVIALGTAAVVLWQLTLFGGLLTNPPGTRRFTGSRFVGNPCPTCFPTTVWLFDSSPVISADQWTLTIIGKVDHPLTVRYPDVSAVNASLTSPLDCTGGWAENLEWQGVAASQLLAQAGVQKDAILVRFMSATGHFAELPLAEANAVLLATHVGGVVLPPEHGFPMRLVAPARRGFQWTKWLTAIQVE